MVPIEALANDLAAIPQAEFTRENVLVYLRQNPVDVESMEPYLYFCPASTRFLIRKLTSPVPSLCTFTRLLTTRARFMISRRNGMFLWSWQTLQNTAL